MWGIKMRLREAIKTTIANKSTNNVKVQTGRFFAWGWRGKTYGGPTSTADAGWQPGQCIVCVMGNKKSYKCY